MIGKCFDIEKFSKIFSLSNCKIPTTPNLPELILNLRFSELSKNYTLDGIKNKFFFLYVSSKKSDSLGANSNWYHQLEQIQLG